MDSSQKTQIVDSLKKANNILVTVSTNPSVDQLAAAIGLTLLLNKLGKHATAVFSGQIPSTLEFLQPETTLEKNTDSMRDFIIALDKSKADKLRYKVEDQMVKVFITPYRTSITQEDLEFSQGDFNVEVVMALGVSEQTDLDQAITAHGRILHDASVISVNTKAGASLGSINWVEPASSLCEMLVDLGLMLKADVLDAQMSTAFLTGIVAETNRFSNEKTSSTTMQMSAKLMSAGADQQLVATKLQEPVQAPEPIHEQAPDEIQEAELPLIAEDTVEEAPQETPPPPADGSLEINHAEEQPEEEHEPEAPADQEIHIDENGQLMSADTQVVTQPSEPSRIILQPPTLGGTLTANSEPEGLDPALDALGATIGTPLLSHEPQEDAVAPAVFDAPQYAAPIMPPSTEPVAPPEPPVYEVPEVGVAATETLAALEESINSPHVQQEDDGQTDVDSARDAVLQAANGVAPQILEPVQALNAQPMDLNLGDIPAVSTSPASDYDFSPPIPTPTQLPDGSEQGAIFDPSSPPPVPPPMMPPADDPSIAAL